MKTYAILGTVGMGLFTLVVVCARGQVPKEVEPSPIVDGTVMAPHTSIPAQPHLLGSDVGHHYIPRADLWATYCSEKGCGPSPHRNWHPLSVLCSLFKFPARPECRSGGCTSCASKAGHRPSILSELFGPRKRCHCPQCSGYAYHAPAPKAADAAPAVPTPAAPAVVPDEPVPAPPAPAPPAPVDAKPMEDEDPAPVPPRDLQSPPAADVPPSPVPANDVPEAAAKRDQLRVPRNEIPTKETRHSSRRVKSKFATYRLSDYIKTD